MNNPAAEIYYERQKGGLCRMHALNAFFGKPAIKEMEFPVLCKEYDAYLEKTGRIHEATSEVLKNDTVGSNQHTIISYILKKYNYINCIYVPMNYLPRILKDRGMNSITDLIYDTDFIFMFNEGHIWGIRKKDNDWYNVDSVSGVRRTNILACNATKNVGFIIPRSIKSPAVMKDLKHYISQIEKHLQEHQVFTKEFNAPEEVAGLLKEGITQMSDPRYKMKQLEHFLYFADK